MKDSNKVAIEIINSIDAITDYAVASKGKYFEKQTKILERNGIYYKCKAFIVFTSEKDGNSYTVRTNERNLMDGLAKIDKSGHLDISEARNIPEKSKCTKCHGVGYIQGYSHVMGGVCFKCSGTGTK